MVQRINSLIWKTKYWKIHNQNSKENNSNKNEDSIQGLWGDINHKNIYTIELQELQQREQWIENLLEEIITKNFHFLAKKITIHSRKHRQSPKKMNPRRLTPR